ncbi:S-adenosyl-L-methionine-dependent methyltransferase superfamily protein [Citrus sinensis]|uniref:7-methylxanthine methyltransferase 1-like isoform X1 n=2 Tax=Citrus sinensis TaxID=2711 RepID=UPI0003D74AA0|nr:7-methylxanthine methyltransferase 1-like isoform X1 [Citrus sinensis]XP_024042316.1 probable caffeine synthase 2 [Citrus x clementina]KAH9702384.1 S-adenosyl-L-methionine-dependent methyltransferase superfamily protein [Citrus sinensis]GAY40384.1 hypothetical protein CUMW_051510 [Citrus unshiu]
MDVKEVLFMNKGDGENSYAQNSPFTQRVIELSKPVLESAVQSLFGEEVIWNKVFNVADLGCASNASTFSVMSSVIENVLKKCVELNAPIPEFQLYLNDLPGNDFNTLFKGLSSFADRYNDASLFMMGAPGSFYGRLFPTNSLQLAHSSYGVHWLSKVPKLTDEAGLPLINKGKIFISKTSPVAVKEAYLRQFEEDFSLFLKSRSQEMVPNGRLVLVFNGRPSADFTRDYCYPIPWESLSEAIAAMVSEGLIQEEKLDSFNVPVYAPSQKELKGIVSKEGSFELEQLETFPINFGDKNLSDKLFKNMRSVTESMISHQFGEEILDKLYDKFTQISIEDMATNEEYKVLSFLVVLRRKATDH